MCVIHDYYPFALEDECRFALMAAELVCGLAILVVVRLFPMSLGEADSGTPDLKAAHA
jgi:hypothetical protein